MNGLEAVALMQQNKKVIKLGKNFIYKIMDNAVYFKELSGDEREWVIDDNFSFSATYEEYIEPKVLTGWERVKKHKRYNVIETKQQTSSCLEDGDGFDRELYEKANYFSTKEKLEEINFKQTLFRKLQRFSDENGGSEIDWSNTFDQDKFIIYYDYNNNRGVSFTNHKGIRYFNSVYFISGEIAQKAIDLFHDDLIKYFTGDWRKNSSIDSSKGASQ